MVTKLTPTVLGGLLRSSTRAVGLAAFLAGGAAAQDAAESPDFAALAEAQGAANAEPGARQVPARTIPVPQGASAEAQVLIGAPYSRFWNAVGATADEWRAFEAQSAAATEPLLADLRESLGVTLEEATIGGVPVLILMPDEVPEGRAGQTVLNLHGGGYVYGSGVSGTYEATLMAAYGGYRVIAVDYRMPPDAPYPAAVDDATAVWRALVEEEGADPASVAVNGTSAGGGLALATLLRVKAEGLPMSGALAANTPWADLTGSSDSYRTNEWVDNVVVSYDGYLDDAARLYAGDADLADPGVSPLFGDLAGLPPTILISGTRDLFLSDAARVQRKLRQAGVVAELQLFEGLSHGQYLFDPAAPETVEMFEEITRFLDAHLAG